MANAKKDPSIEQAELTPEVKEELFTAPVDIIPSGIEAPTRMDGNYDQNSGTFSR